ncbi:MAG: alpha/beta hydrolase [Candidatus ainarchaeum sp.]|nr:alpha/beta hydrolase [Candidatus ainarchaeum sp.]
MRFLAIFAILSVLLLAGCAMPGAGASQQGTPQQGAGGTPPEPAASQNQSGQPATPAQPAGIPSEHVTFSSFSWVIHGTYYDSTAAEPTRGIILLPMLDTGRDSYPPSLITRMHDEISNAPVLAMDLRGNGNTTNFGTWQGFQLEDYKAMSSDVVSAMTYMKLRHPTIKEFYLVGASMGSTAAITAAARSPSVIKVAMLSPGMSYHGVDIGSATETYLHPLFIAASREDRESADAASQVFALSPTSDKTLKIYEGIAHGTDMFEATKYDDESLEGLLMAFLKK